MASRYSGFTRSARSAFHAGTRNSFRTASSNPPRNHFAVHSQKRRNFENVAQMFRRRGAQSMVPFHNAVASAKLVSHLAFNSRTCSGFSLCTFPCPHFTWFPRLSSHGPFSAECGSWSLVCYV